MTHSNPRPDPLRWIGGHATLMMAAGVLLGLAAPPLAALAKPLLVPALVIPLALALLRLDWDAACAWRKHPALLAGLAAWLLLASPFAVAALAAAMRPLGLPAPLAEALILMAAASPIVSSVAIAMFVGLDASLAVVAVLLATALVPLTLPPIAALLAGVAIEMGIVEFTLRLAWLVGSAFAAAWLMRRVVPAGVLLAHREHIDGLAVLNLVVFALAIMDGVTAFALRSPGYVTMALAAAFAFNLLLQAAGYFAFRRLGRRAALTVALLSGNCNMGLVLVALQGRASFEVTVFFALAQIPMYTLPALLAPAYRRLLARAGDDAAGS
jgi:bile acid:Na+ symporter, BASS family